MEERVEVMTDYQLRFIVNLILKVVREGLDSKKDPEKIIQEIEAIRDGKLESGHQPKK